MIFASQAGERGSTPRVRKNFLPFFFSFPSHPLPPRMILHYLLEKRSDTGKLSLPSSLQVTSETCSYMSYRWYGTYDGASFISRREPRKPLVPVSCTFYPLSYLPRLTTKHLVDESSDGQWLLNRERERGSWPLGLARSGFASIVDALLQRDLLTTLQCSRQRCTPTLRIMQKTLSQGGKTCSLQAKNHITWFVIGVNMVRQDREGTDTRVLGFFLF